MSGRREYPSPKRWKRKPVVLILGPLPPPVHGASQVNSALIAFLRCQGRYEVRPLPSQASGHAVRYHVYRLTRHVRALMTVFIQSVPRRKRVIVVSVAGGSGVLYQVPVVLAAVLLGYRVIFHHHSFAYLTQRSVPTACLIAIGKLRKAGRHLVLCERMGEGLAARYEIRKGDIRAMSNAELLGFAPRRTERPRTSSGQIVLGHLSNLTLEKGLDTAIDTFEHCRASGLDVRLRVAGPNNDPQARRLIEAAVRRHADLVEYVGQLSRPHVHTFMAGLDYFVFPSRYKHEAEPLVILEAQAAGARVIATPIGCIPSMLTLHDHIASTGDFPETVERAIRSDRADGSTWLPISARSSNANGRALLELIGA